MSQLNSLPPPERSVPVVNVSLVVHVLVRAVLEPFYRLGRKTARRVERTWRRVGQLPEVGRDGARDAGGRRNPLFLVAVGSGCSATCGICLASLKYSFVRWAGGG